MTKSQDSGHASFGTQLFLLSRRFRGRVHCYVTKRMQATWHLDFQLAAS